MSSFLYKLFTSYPVETLSVLLGVASLFILPYLYRSIKKQWRIYRALSNLPTDSTDSHWLMGHGMLVLKKMYSGQMLDYFAAFSRLGKITRVKFGPFFDLAMCNHPDALRFSLGPHPKADIAYFPLTSWLGVSLLTGNGNKWLRTRRLLTPAFHFDILKPYISVYEDCAKELVANWKQKALTEGAFDVFPSISLLTLDVMLRCTCSFESNCQSTTTHSPYVAAVYELSALAMERIIFFPAYYDWIYAMMPSKRRRDKACALVHKFAMDVIKERRRALTERKGQRETDQLATRNGTKRRKYLDFIDILLEAKDEKGEGLTDDEIRAEVDTFMFEGHDTTASGITWTLYNLARYPEHQMKCREEADAAFEEGDNLSWETVKGLKYIKYCLKESLRLFPPVPIVIRSLEKDFTFEGHTLPEGSWVAANMYTVHRNPDVWEDPETFNPLRFADNAGERHSHSFAAFSAGPRNCIGQEFAMNEEKVVIAHILHNFDISLTNDERRNVIKRYMIILRPKDGLYLQLTPRFNNQ